METPGTTLREVTVVGRNKMKDAFIYTVLDETLQKHSVWIPLHVLEVTPRGYERGSDDEHLDRVARGTVLLSLDPENSFHRVDPETVRRAYEATRE